MLGFFHKDRTRAEPNVNNSDELEGEMEEPCEFDWLTVKRDAIAEIHKQVVHSAKLWDAVKGSQLTTQEQLLTLVEVATISESIKRNVASGPASAELLVRVSSSNLSEQDKHAIASSFLQQQSWKIDDDVLRGVASFAGYDEAIVMTRDLKVLGYGAKITVKGKAAPQVCTFDAYPGKQKIEPKEVESVGGMRHQSAARFVAAHTDALAIVVSEDRHITQTGCFSLCCCLPCGHD